MNLKSVAYRWKVCPQQHLTRGRLVKEWATQLDLRVNYVTGAETPQEFEKIELEAWADRWAREVVADNDRTAAHGVLQRLRWIRKEADISPDMAERWNMALLPFILASERALAQVLGGTDRA